MKTFEDCLLGHFSNQNQAMKDPSRYAHINISHIKLDSGLYYGEQAYAYQSTNPYRQFILKIIKDDSDYIIQNFQISDPTPYVGYNNLDKLSSTPLEKRVGCDIRFRLDGCVYYGQTDTQECIVNYKGKPTFLQNEIELTEDSYWVLDKGFDLETKTQVWGAKWGYLKFYRRHDIIQPSPS